MKGQQPFVSHTMMVGFASILLVIVAASLVVVNEDYGSFVAETSVDNICIEFRNAINYIVSNDLDHGKINLNLVDKIGDKNYVISGSDEIYLQWENNERECKTGYGVEYTGRVEGGPISLTYDNSDDLSVFIGGVFWCQFKLILLLQ